MKNINKSIFITAAIGILALSVYAVDIVPTSAAMVKKMAVKNGVAEKQQVNSAGFLKEYKELIKIDVAALPKILKSAVMTKYVAYAIAEAYRENDGTFRLILKNGENKIVTYYSENGKYLKQEMIKTMQVIALS